MVKHLVFCFCTCMSVCYYSVSAEKLKRNKLSEIQGTLEIRKRDTVAAYPVNIGWYPYHVAIARKLNSIYVQFCSGCLISNNIVLTATNCTVDLVDHKNIYVIAGAVSLKRINKSQIRKIKYFKSYSRSQGLNYKFSDVSLIIVDNFVPNYFVQPIKITNRVVQDFEICVITSWIVIEGNREYKLLPEMLHAVSTFTVPRKLCEKEPCFTDGLLCSKFIYDKTLFGEPGSPLVCNNLLYGIVSFGSTKLDNCFTGNNTEFCIDIYYYRDWIDKFLNQAESKLRSMRSSGCKLLYFEQLLSALLLLGLLLIG